jgi:hypothetical protein
MSGITYNHFICLDCDKHIETEYFYPDEIKMCEDCRIKNKVLSSEQYTPEMLK